MAIPYLKLIACAEHSRLYETALRVVGLITFVHIMTSGYSGVQRYSLAAGTIIYTSSPAVAERPRDASCFVSVSYNLSAGFDSEYGCVQLHSVLFSSF